MTLFSVCGRVAMFLMGCGIILTVVLTSTSTTFRFAGTLAQYADPLLNQEGPLDVVFLGSSRVMRSVIVDTLSDRVAHRIGRPVIIQDLSISGSGYDISYSLLRELYMHHSVGLVVIEYRWEGQRSHHALFPQFARWSELLEVPASGRDRYSAISAVVRQKLSWIATVGSRGTWYSCDHHCDVRPASNYDPSRPYGPSETRLRSAMETGRSVEPQLRLTDTDNEIFNYYFRRIIDLAHSHDSKVAILLIPGMNERPFGTSERAILEETFGTKVIGLDDSQIKMFFPGDYADENHFGLSAIPKYEPLLSDWIAEIVDKGVL